MTEEQVQTPDPGPSKNVALVAHDNCKKDLVEWVDWNWRGLLDHRLVCTGTTGKMVEERIVAHYGKPLDNKMTRLKSGPLGGDQQLGALISEGKIDVLIFFWDPMQPHPHEVDVKALLRISVLYNIPTACNRSTADFLISSTLMGEQYQPKLTDYTSYSERDISV